MDWIFTQTQQVFAALSRLLTTPFFDIGNKQYSISSLIALGVLALLVFLAARSISEWIKRGLLVRLKVDRGSREAIASVISYLLTAIGLLILLQQAGINLSSIAVFAGVLGIGFGFGLQNLASNFISGLTLLVEQPIKVGDFIEVDNLLGTVENISIRSTIVRTIDGVCVIVPNIRFVENNIVNWSYRDPKCCIHIPVGVAYGTDPILVTEALSSAARMEPNVLSNPSPKVWFKGFGDSSLNFELLAWIDQPHESEPIKSALNFRIDHEFRHRGIEIPFPHRDLHIRNAEALAALFNKSGATDINNAKVHESEVKPLEQQKPTPKSPNNWTLRDLLRRVTYFEQCSDLELRQLIEYGYRQLFPAKQVVCQENDPGESFYIILSGSVEVFSQRLEKYIATLHEGEFFGEMSLLMGAPRSATVRTLSDTILFVVDRNDLQKVLVDHQELADHIAQKLSERQQVLRDLGLLTEAALEQTPLVWIRNRIQTLFGI
ncbi:mechanosensitive ion channel [Microcoleus sp. FACHB-831]|uniref:cyclic nucleotide-binding domain-containing protein n=1 Tax=Microcoleus sp. FACHB-831 TaxID=2692827 RepID=UPI0016862D8D|nr:cyclic nucleotide-binding domain-containing protein [Microcoleus sp. FACHB-831]MBD1922913.1 mechanosensitive ion channel [Microcoleus sp. FACHB-831]